MRALSLLLCLLGPLVAQESPEPPEVRQGFERIPIKETVVPGWERILDRAHPDYNRVELVRDSAQAFEGTGFLRFTTQGGHTALQMLLRETLLVDPVHAYELSVRVRISGTIRNKVFLSVRWLDRLAQPLSEHRSLPLTRAPEWSPLHLRVLRIPDEARWGQVRLSFEGTDYQGTAEFDDLVCRALPRLDIRPADRSLALFGPDESVAFQFNHPGSDGTRAEVQTRVVDVHGREIQATESTPVSTDKPASRRWTLPPGYYELETRLLRKSSPVLSEITPLIVLHRTDSVPSDLISPILNPFHTDLADVRPYLKALGASHAKIIVWDRPGGERDHAPSTPELQQLLQVLFASGLHHCVGVLASPPLGTSSDGTPENIIAFLARDREKAAQMLEEVLDPLGPWITQWQLGSDADPSVVEAAETVDVLNAIRSRLKEEKRLIALGVPRAVSNTAGWKDPGADFVSLVLDAIPDTDIVPPTGDHHWVLTIPPLEAGALHDSQLHQAGELLRRGIELVARHGSLRPIYVPFEPGDTAGIVTRDGHPRLPFLALLRLNEMLTGTKAQSGFNLFLPPIVDHVFTRGDETIIAFWSPKDPITQELHLGPGARLIDPFGTERLLESGARVTATATPQFIVGFDPRLIETQLSLRFYDPGNDEKPDDTLRLKPEPVVKRVKFQNLHSEDLSGITLKILTADLPPRWQASPTQVLATELAPDATLDADFSFTLPASEVEGNRTIHFELAFRREGKDYRLRLERNLTVESDLHIVIRSEPVEDPAQPNARRIFIDVENRTPKTLNLTLDIQATGQSARPRTYPGITPGGSLPAAIQYTIADITTLTPAQRWIRVTARDTGAARLFSNRMEQIK